MVTIPKIETLPKEQQEKILDLRQRQKPRPKEKTKKICYVCGTDKNLIIHHISYDPPETIRLCCICHSLIHNKPIGWVNNPLEYRCSKRFYNYMKTRPREEIERQLKYTSFCSYGKCQSCLLNCAIRRIKADWIKEAISTKRKREVIKLNA
jgi:hypothetical protein